MLNPDCTVCERERETAVREMDMQRLGGVVVDGSGGWRGGLQKS